MLPISVATRLFQMEFRSLREPDLDQLLALYRQLDPGDKETPLTDAAARWQQIKNIPGSDVIVGCLDGRIVTSCTLIVIPNITRCGLPYALIENVVTDAALRNRGLGTTLLKEAAQRAWDSGCYKVMLLTGSKKPEVLAFYEGAGFEQNKTGFQMRRLPRRME